VPTTVAYFSGGDELRGSVGSGASYSETQREGNFASRRASLEEVTELHVLLGIGTKVIAVPPKRPRESR
jgi:hypothetical protein